MAEANDSNPSDKFNLEATAHEQSQVNQVGQIIGGTVIFGATQRAGKPFQAPPLPSYYVDRPEYSQDLKTRLLTESEDVRTLVVTAIHGLGSVGKSTLATALAHDPEVQAHFGDGILWVTLGQQPNLLSLLSGWVQALGDYNFKATSVEAASMQLRTLLYDKAVLLVVDDGWNTQDVQPFNVGGARCQVLVTTREAEIAQVLGARKYSLDVMSPSQAMELLTKKLGRNLTDTETQSAQALAKAVGYLPLALELAAAQVAGGTLWTVLVQDMQLEVARLISLDNKSARDAHDEASLKKLSLTASLNLSIRRLQEETRQNFIWLGILPEDVTITQAMTATLWDMNDERDAADELGYLYSKALLLSGVPLTDGTPTYRLHDLFHDLARNLLTAPLKPKRTGNEPGLGITLSAAHATFLEKYRNKTSKNLWHTLPYDGYIHQHLVWHLEKAQKVEEIHSLLREDSETGGNGWYEACEHLGQTANFVTDVARAWQLAEKEWTLTILPQVIGLQCRYALIIASLNSLAANLPVELLIALLKKNLWTPSQGLAYVLQSSNPEKKANLLTQLANHLSPNLKELALSKALAATREIQDKYARAKLLSSLATQLPELLPDALAATREIQDKYARADALSSLATQLPELLPEALTAAREIQDVSSRARVLSSLADKMPRELLPKALAAAREIQDVSSRVRVLSSLATQLPELLPEALAAAREIQDKYARADALSSLATQLPELLPEALAAAKEIQDEPHRAQVLSSLADKLPELLPEVLAAAREIQPVEQSKRVHILYILAVKLPPELLLEVLPATTEITNERFRAEVLSILAAKLPELLPEALAAARKIQDEEFRARVLSSFAGELPLELLPEALAAARETQDEEFRADALSSLAAELPELLPAALAAAREIQYEPDRAKALSSLVVKLPELLPEALAAAREIQDESGRAEALISLAAKLPELLPEALVATREMKDKFYCAKGLSILAVKLPELLPEALVATREIKDKFYCADVLSSLAAQLPELLPEALAAAREIQNESNRADVLSSLADKMPRELLPEVLAAAREIQNESNRADVLSSLADKMPELLPELLTTVREIQYKPYRARLLSSLAAQLPELLPEALAAVREINYSCADALSSLATQLPELLPDALTAAREIQDKYARADALSSLAEKLSQIQKTALFDYWRETLHILSVRTRRNLLSDIKALTPVIFTLGDKHALKDTASAIQDVSRWWR